MSYNYKTESAARRVLRKRESLETRGFPIERFAHAFMNILSAFVTFFVHEERPRGRKALGRVSVKRRGDYRGREVAGNLLVYRFVCVVGAMNSGV